MELDRLLAVSMGDDQARLSQISDNVANVSTPGYKRQQRVASTFNVEFDRTLSPHPIVNGERSGQTFNAVSRRAGSVRATGRGQDVYVEGNNLLQITTPSGIAYTHQAALRIDAEGKLVNESGFSVTTSGGNALLTSKEFTITARGEIMQDAKVVARVMTFEPQHDSVMEACGNGLYRFSGEMHQTAQGRFKPGFIEGSNVDTPQEMVSMLETIRHFESMQKITQAYTELHDKAARYLGDF
jgi:flagellar basal-body rod protein FlgG